MWHDYSVVQGPLCYTCEFRIQNLWEHLLTCWVGTQEAIFYNFLMYLPQLRATVFRVFPQIPLCPLCAVSQPVCWALRYAVYLWAHLLLMVIPAYLQAHLLLMVILQMGVVDILCRQPVSELPCSWTVSQPKVWLGTESHFFLLQKLKMYFPSFSRS